VTTRKLIQITDTHLFEDPEGRQKGVNTRRSLAAVVAHAAATHPDADAVLLTGDLSQDETAASYELLLELIEPLRGAPVHAIPGNHDDAGHMRRILEQEGIAVLRDLQLDNWRVALLNSQVPGRVHGELGADQIAALSRSLGSSEYIIVALHHPPLSIDSAWLDASRCLDGQALLEALADSPVRAVVCGHIHQQFETRADGLPVMATPSTCVQFKPGMEQFATDDEAAPGYRVFELGADGGWSSSVVRVEAARSA